MPRAWIYAFTTALLTASLPPREASACGAVFPRPRDQTYTVEQSGLNVLYTLDDGVVEAHIQIQHRSVQGDELAWIVPVMARPEVAIGSDPLFERLLEATVPTFDVTRSEEDNCDGGFIGCGVIGIGGGDEDYGKSEDPEDPLHVFEGEVGVYDYAWLEGGTVEEITQWLDDNGYAQNEQAPPILQEYLDEDFGFLAFKLPRQSSGGEHDIHPVVIRYPGTELCLPLRLTRIASSDQLSVRAFFLGPARVVPSNYRHVELNLLALSLTGDNYDQVVFEATHEQGTQGRAFVTEFAGPPPSPSSSVFSESWDSRAFAEIEPSSLTEVLREQRLLWCAADECTPEHPLLLHLLETYLPPPPGRDALEFYACTSCNPGAHPRLEWDREGFVEAMEQYIVGPGEHADDLLALPYLTRMYARISPEEMTVDPLFHDNPELGDVTNDYPRTHVANCEGPDRVVFDDGRRVFLRTSGYGGLPDMDASLRVEEFPPQGAPVVLADHTAEIEQVLEDWNAEHAPPPQGCDCQAARRRFRGSGPLLLVLGLGLLARRRRERSVTR